MDTTGLQHSIKEGIDEIETVESPAEKIQLLDSLIGSFRLQIRQLLGVHNEKFGNLSAQGHALLEELEEASTEREDSYLKENARLTAVEGKLNYMSKLQSYARLLVNLYFKTKGSYLAAIYRRIYSKLQKMYSKAYDDFKNDYPESEFHSTGLPDLV